MKTTRTGKKTSTTLTHDSLIHGSLTRGFEDLFNSIPMVWWTGETLAKYDAFRKRLEHADQYLKEHNNG